MSSANIKTVSLLLIFLIGAGCGLDNNPSSGHDPNKPLPVFISNAAAVTVDHTQGGIIKTPDGMAMLSISQTALNADTDFEIKPYPLNPAGGPIFYAGQMYEFSPAIVPNLNPGAKLIVTLYYDPTPFPEYDPGFENYTPYPTSDFPPYPPNVFELDLQLGLLQDNVDYTRRCWKKGSFDSSPIVAGQTTHSISTHDTTELGIFGITSKYSNVCPYNFIYRPF